MAEFELDQFKSSWQNQSKKSVYDTTQIESMLNKSSRNYVKYILFISIIEFAIIFAANIYYTFIGDDTSELRDMVLRLGLRDTDVFEQTLAQLYLALKIVSLILTATFVYFFYKNYCKISVEANLRKLILQIIRFKKTVQLFILANIILVITFTVILGAFTLMILSNQHIDLATPGIRNFIIALVMMMGISVLLIWIYYRLVYGFILRRLAKNLHQLQKIEQEN